jgi:hypothetical protein
LRRWGESFQGLNLRQIPGYGQGDAKDRPGQETDHEKKNG